MKWRERIARVLLAVAATALLGAGALTFVTIGPAAAPAAPTPAVPVTEDAAPVVDDTAGQAQSALVTAEDDRILTIVSDPRPVGSAPYEVAPPAPGLPATVVLPARESAYGLDSLERLGAARLIGPDIWTFDRSVLVGSGATLRIDAPGATLRLPGLTSVVAFKGVLELAGSAIEPLTVTSWDPRTRSADRDLTDGRAYLRSSGGRMDLRDVRASDLGFWSGRTGGLAWTGSAGEPGTGSARGVTAQRNQYGLFTSRVADLTITGGVVRDNLVDGLLIHRESAGVTVDGLAATGSARHGIAVSSGTERIRIANATANSNAHTGIRIDGAPLAVAATAGGANVRPGSGFTVEGSTVAGNGRVGVLADSTGALVVRDNTVSGSPDGLVVRGPAVDPQITGNRLQAGEFGLAVRDGVTGARLSGNTTGPAVIAVQVTDATAEVRENVVDGASRYGVSLVGDVHGSEIDANTVSGRGLAAVDTNRVALGAVVGVGSNDDAGWTVQRDELAYWRDYVIEHPLLWLWLLLLVLPLARWWNHRRADRPAHPYAHVPPGPPAATGHVPGRPALTPADRLSLARASTRAAEQRPSRPRPHPPVPVDREDPAQDDTPGDTSTGDTTTDDTTGSAADGSTANGSAVEATVALPVTRVTVVSGKGAAR